MVAFLCLSRFIYVTVDVVYSFMHFFLFDFFIFFLFIMFKMSNAVAAAAAAAAITGTAVIYNPILLWIDSW